MKSKLKKVKISDLNRHWLKPRITDQSTLLAVRNSVEEMSVLCPPTVNEKSMTVLSLHSVIDAVSALGESEIEVFMVDLKPEQELAAYLALNNHLNEWDWQKVSNVLKKLALAKIPLTPTCFCAAKIKALTACGDDWTPREPAQLDGEQAKQEGFNFGE